ncbi:MAG: ribosomal protein S18-alanine N-acetyltransferase [Clostridia bacterium]|nr:ribosomal protein S18-alanine N-acetyltransferase [Clostridia bacterium]
MELSIEKCTKKDAPCVAKIEKECFSKPFKEEDIISYLKSPIWHFLVAKCEGEVVGYVSFTIIIDECQIVNVATSQGYRKMGVGKSLIKELLSYAKKSGVSKVYLEVRESNLPAISLYKKYGFEIVGVSKNHYSQPTENALLMNLEI